MMRMKKALCIILSLIMLIFCASCGKDGEDEKNTEPVTEETTGVQEEETTKLVSNAKASFVLPYSQEDSLNPFKAKTQINRAITTLLYDSLYSVGQDFSPSAVLARSEETENGSITVTLKDSLKFSDGSPLNASDVVYSFNLAKESDRYSSLLGEIESATAITMNEIKFTLKEPDIYVRNILTFPVVNYGSGEDEVPTGSGRYVLSKDKLSYNKEHVSGKKPKIKTIELCSLSDKINFVDSLQIGNISFIFRDLSDCDVQRAAAQSVPITLNNLVYLGINSEKGALGDKVLRQAINLAIDKEALCAQDFQGYAVRTESPFNPTWGEEKEKASVFDQSEAVELLEKNGYKYASETDTYRRDKNGRTLSLNIVVPSENEFRSDAAQSVAKYLSQIGIAANIVSLKYSSFKERVKSGKFDLYLGEVRLCENMSLSPFFTKGGKTRYGIDLKSPVISSYKKMLSGDESVFVFDKEFSKEMPFVPICYRQGIVMASNTLSDNIKSTQTDLFSNIGEWKMS